jgi:hypothetical protein
MSVVNNRSTIRNFRKIDSKRQQKKDDRENDSGNWEYTPYPTGSIPEATILRDLLSPNSFDPTKVPEILSPPKTKEQIILEKYPPTPEQLKLLKKMDLSAEEKKNLDKYLSKMNKADRTILTNLQTIKQTAIKRDIDEVTTLGRGAKPSTIEGRKYLLLFILNQELQRNNNDMIVNIWLRLKENEFKNVHDFDHIYMDQITRMNAIVSKLDIIELQFTKFHSQMPPLNQKGFTCFDEWQKQVIQHIDDNTSVVVNAPTSAGKSVLSGYAVTKGDILFIVPTDALVWQMSAYIGSIVGSSVPLITSTYQSNSSRKEMEEILLKAPAIVGTPNSIVDYLPSISMKKFKWIIFDEIHMIGKPEGSAMEQIAKVLPNTPVLALSATIGNTEELVQWFQKISPDQRIAHVTCDKRFFNLQRFYYNEMENQLVTLHPLALVEEVQFVDGSILTKNLQPTPPNAWDLAQRIGFDKLGDLDPHIYFQSIERIELSQATQYFYKLIEWLVEIYRKDQQFVMSIVNQYKHEQVVHTDVDLVKLAFKLKENDKCPGIFFQKNTIACLQMVFEFARSIEMMEDVAHPKLFQERMRLIKKADRLMKKVKNDSKTSSDDSRKAMKEMTGKVKLKKDGYGVSSVPKNQEEIIIPPSLQEPHPDFILNQIQYFNETIVSRWNHDLKRYFPGTGEYFHWIIKLLWRGVGVYAKGLPDPYLRLVQTLACQKQLAVVFSDMSLVFGVSMPFRTSVIVRSPIVDDDLDSMLFHQMAGRAGRRGLDKEGNVVFAGYSWDRIKELSISKIPIVTGTDNVIYTIPHANKLVRAYGSATQQWENTCKNFLNSEISDEDSQEFLQGIESNYTDGGGWSFALTDDINHLHMNWRFRDSDDSVLVPFLLPYFRRAFEGKDHTKEMNQIFLAHFLSRFISTASTEDEKQCLEDPEILQEEPYNQIFSQLEEFQIDVPSMVDNRVFLSIQQNSMVPTANAMEADKLRQRLLVFGDKLKHIQHYCYHSKITCLSKIMGKLLTRIWWIYHSSSPVMKEFMSYDEQELNSSDDEQSDDDESSS